MVSQLFVNKFFFIVFPVDFFYSILIPRSFSEITELFFSRPIPFFFSFYYEFGSSEMGGLFQFVL